MGIVSQDAVKQFKALIDQVDEPLKRTFENMHQGYPLELLVRFLEAREWNGTKAYRMLVDCLTWRIQNEIDYILAKPIMPTDLYRAIRDTQLIGLSGYSKEGLPVFAIGVGLSSFDKAFLGKDEIPGASSMSASAAALIDLGIVHVQKLYHDCLKI